MSIRPFFTKERSTDFAHLYHPWANPEPTVKRAMKEKKFTFKDSLRKFDRSAICDPVHLVTASTFSVLPRQRPCFDVIRLDNWGDVVDLVRKHGNHSWDLNTTGSSGFPGPAVSCMLRVFQIGVLSNLGNFLILATA